MKISYIILAMILVLIPAVILLLGGPDRSQEPGPEDAVQELIAYEGYASAVFAGGCFWGVEYFFEQQEGVIAAISGYTGGRTENPGYQDVSYQDTGHVEAVIVYYDAEVTDYRELAELFFEIHDPEQQDGQGPDIGDQYLSVIFYADEQERLIAQELIEILTGEGYDIATSVTPRAVFWPAEAYHQDYYAQKGSLPYCHVYTPRFPECRAASRFSTRR